MFPASTLHPNWPRHQQFLSGKHKNCVVSKSSYLMVQQSVSENRTRAGGSGGASVDSVSGARAAVAHVDDHAVEEEARLLLARRGHSTRIFVGIVGSFRIALTRRRHVAEWR